MKRSIKLAIPICLSAFLACGNNQAPKTEAATSSDKVLVEIKKLEPQRFEHHLDINGDVEAIKEAFVSPEISGQIKKIHVREGDRVAENALLVSLNAETIRSSIAELNTSLALAGTVYQRRAELWEKKIGSEIQFLEAKTNKESLENRLKAMEAQLEMAEIRAPISGIVDKISKKEGELAIPGMELLQLVNLQRVRINAELAETFLSSIHSGDIVDVTFPTYPDMHRQAKISRISQTVNPKNRTVTVQVEMDNPGERIKPNMMASLKVIDFAAEGAIIVPAIIIKNDLEGRFIYVAEHQSEDLIAQKRYISTGLTQDGETMVTQGLSFGQEVIIVGYNMVNNGAPIRIN